MNKRMSDLKKSMEKIVRLAWGVVLCTILQYAIYILQFLLLTYVSFMPYVSFCCDETWWSTSKLGRKGFIWLTFSYYCSSRKEVKTYHEQAGRNLELELMQTEAMEECCLLTCSFWLAQPVFLQNPGQPAWEWLYLQWAGPSLINHIRTCLVNGS